MAAAQFVLIPGRSSRQGVTLNEGKYTDGYLDETSTLRMNPEDMQRMGVSTGDEVRMWNDVGEVVVPCLDAKEECPEGLVFICYGDKSSQLMGGETHGSGMPDSKGLDVFIHPVSQPGPASLATVPATKGRAAVPNAPSEIGTEIGTEIGQQPSQPVAQPSTASRAPSPSSVPSTKQPASGLGPTLVMGLLVVVLVVLAVVMKLTS